MACIIKEAGKKKHLFPSTVYVVLEHFTLTSVSTTDSKMHWTEKQLWVWVKALLINFRGSNAKTCGIFFSLRCQYQRLAELLEMRPLNKRNIYADKREKEVHALNLLVWPNSSREFRQTIPVSLKLKLETIKWRVFKVVKCHLLYKAHLSSKRIQNKILI